MSEKWLKPKGIIGLFKARSIGDTIAVTKMMDLANLAVSAVN